MLRIPVGLVSREGAVPVHRWEEAGWSHLASPGCRQGSQKEGCFLLDNENHTVHHSPVTGETRGQVRKTAFVQLKNKSTQQDMRAVDSSDSWKMFPLHGSSEAPVSLHVV